MQIDVLDVDPGDLTDREKEELAVYVHEFLQEEFAVHPDSVAVEGYDGTSR